MKHGGSALNPTMERAAHFLERSRQALQHTDHPVEEDPIRRVHEQQQRSVEFDLPRRLSPHAAPLGDSAPSKFEVPTPTRAWRAVDPPHVPYTTNNSSAVVQSPPMIANGELAHLQTAPSSSQNGWCSPHCELIQVLSSQLEFIPSPQRAKRADPLIVHYDDIQSLRLSPRKDGEHRVSPTTSPHRRHSSASARSPRGLHSPASKCVGYADQLACKDVEQVQCILQRNNSSEVSELGRRRGPRALGTQEASRLPAAAESAGAGVSRFIGTPELSCNTSGVWKKREDSPTPVRFSPQGSNGIMDTEQKSFADPLEHGGPTCSTGQHGWNDDTLLYLGEWWIALITSTAKKAGRNNRVDDVEVFERLASVSLVVRALQCLLTQWWEQHSVEGSEEMPQKPRLEVVKSENGLESSITMELIRGSAHASGRAPTRSLPTVDGCLSFATFVQVYGWLVRHLRLGRGP